MFNRNLPPLWPSRLTALLAVLLVVLLNVLAASPELHARLHGRNQGSEHTRRGHEPVGNADHECAVTLFSHGATALLVFCLRLLLRSPDRGTLWHAGDWLPATRRRYWHAPAHAPPLL
jgi:hypothetical protein